MGPIRGLFRSRKFLLTLLAAVQAVVLNYFRVDQNVWLSISAVLVILIHSIAVEDAAEKGAAGGSVGGFDLPSDAGTVRTTTTTEATMEPDADKQGAEPRPNAAHD